MALSHWGYGLSAVWSQGCVDPSCQHRWADEVLALDPHTPAWGHSPGTGCTAGGSRP